MWEVNYIVNGGNANVFFFLSTLFMYFLVIFMLNSCSLGNKEHSVLHPYTCL